MAQLAGTEVDVQTATCSHSGVAFGLLCLSCLSWITHHATGAAPKPSYPPACPQVPQWQQQEQQQQQLAAAAAAKQGQQLGQGLCLGQCLGLGLRSLDCFNDGVLLCDCSQPHWPVLWTNQAWAEQAGVTIGPEVGPRGFWGLFEAEAKAEPGVGRGAAAAAEQRVRAAAAAQLPFSVVVRRRGSSGGGGAEAGRGSAQLSMAFKPVAGHLPLGAGVPEIAIPSAVDAPAGSTAQGQQQGQQADLPAAAAAAASPALFFAVIQRPESAQAATQGPAVPHGPQGNSAAGSPALAGLPSSSSSGGSEPANGSSLSPETSVPFGGGQMPLGGLPRISSTGTVLSLCNQDGAPLTWLDSRDSITAMTERPEVSELPLKRCARPCSRPCWLAASQMSLAAS